MDRSISQAMEVVHWAEFADANARLAAHVQKRLSGSIAYFATVRPDEWPRVHPLGVMFRNEKCVVVMFPTSPKSHDLHRNQRYAIHCTVEDDAGGGGEVLVTGIAVPTEQTDDDIERGWITFELLVGEVLATTYDRAEKGPVSERWNANQGST